MNIYLLKVILNYKRIPSYLNAICYAFRKNILLFKVNIPGMISLPQGVMLHRLAAALPEKSTIVEIGCYAGLSTAYLIAGSKNKSTVHSIDPFDLLVDQQKKKLSSSKDKGYFEGEISILDKKPSKKKVESWLRSEGLTNFELHQGYSDEIFMKWKKDIDFLWIDGDHNYEQVKKDLLQWSKFLKKGGIIAIDDANKTDKSKHWNMGLVGPTEVARKYIKFPKWINISRIDAMVYAIKNY